MLKISASLLNSWGYLWQVNEEYQDKALLDLQNYLHGIKTPPTPAMQRGIDFEAMAINGAVPIISPIIAGGQYQVYAEKVLLIDGLEVKLLGYLDVLKAGQIYDIKRVTKYEYGKYEDSYQHHAYFTLVPEAYKFTYLVGEGYTEEPYNDKVEIHQEPYYNDGKSEERIIFAVTQFFKWLKMMNLWETYVKNFTIKISGERQK